MTVTIKLDEEYRLIRAALNDAGLDMADSMDAICRDWRRRRDKSLSRTPVDRVAIDQADQWWTQHLAQFRCLIDAPHRAARAERARKDWSAARVRTPAVINTTSARPQQKHHSV